jgi:hypothetical protein
MVETFDFEQTYQTTPLAAIGRIVELVETSRSALL